MADAIKSENSSKETELTMLDVMEEEQELEDDANAVLGGSDDTNCSYVKGYVSRQALYACLTCPSNKEPAAVCLACSYKCHDGHDVVELYTKRNFRCDCGNSKFPEKSCSLEPDKEPVNSLNKYNQNFKGLYCICSRPYPDLEDDTPDEMIQCIMCEDWFHGRHVGSAVPDEYFEMICAQCMKSHQFLYSYLSKFQRVDVTDTIDVVKCEDGSEGRESDEPSPDTLAVGVKEAGIPSIENPTKFEPVNLPVSEAARVQTFIKSERKDCSLKVLRLVPDCVSTGPAFWPDNWRKELCRCETCMQMYSEKNCEYLTNVEDTILVYEERGKKVNENAYDKGMSALSQLDRVKQMEAVRAYTSMKGELKEYLQEFANNKRTVCETDIKEFFDSLKKKKKNNSGIPHFCR